MVEGDPESGTVCFTRRAIHLQPRSRRLFLCTIYRNRARTSPGNVRIWGMRVKKQGYAPDELVTDKLGSYGAVRRELGLSARHEQGLRNNWAEKLTSAGTTARMQTAAFKSAGSAQRFVSMHSAVHNTFNVQRHLISRRTLQTFRAEVVFTQMTKADVLALGARGQHVADLDLGVGDDHAVDEQQHELPALLEGRRGQPVLHPRAERLQ